MANTHRHILPPGTCFFTIHLADRSSNLLIERIDLLRQSVRLCLKTYPMQIRAAVVLPDQLLMIWTLPADDRRFAERWRLIKSTFARHCEPNPDMVSGGPKRRKTKKPIWQRHYREHQISSAAEFQRYLVHCQTAPVRAGLVKSAKDWAYSSIHYDPIHFDTGHSETGNQLSLALDGEIGTEQAA